MPRTGIICGGSWCVDRNKLVDHWPEQDTIAVILAEERQGGGNGANASVDLKRLGAPFPVEAVGLVGNDEDGRFLLALCAGNSIDVRQMRVVADVPTAYTDVMTVQATGRRTFFYRAGSHDRIEPEHFDFAATNAAILHLGLPGTHATMDAPQGGEPSGWTVVLKKARAAGLKTNLELCPIPLEQIASLGRPCLPLLDYLIVNDAEVGALAGVATVVAGRVDVGACRDAVRVVMAKSAAQLVVLHFPGGAIAMTRDGHVVEKPSVRVPREAVKGSNGAGDAFAAGMLLGIHEAWPLHQCLALAHASAAASLRSVTTNGSVENWRDCLALADRWGWREAIA
jgi:sugar/nucleoside kinase (ribokinase family)